MKALTGVEIDFAVAQLEAGADAIWLGDANASSHLISVDMYKQFALEPAFHLHTMPTEAPQLDFTSFQGATEGKNRIQHFFI
jgi:uroporphyrinogen-III decarboxylase